MKITFQMTGGFAHLPALSRPIIIDTALIAPEAAEQLDFLIRETRFFELPERMKVAAKGAADHRTYTLTVEEGLRIHTIHLTDPINDPTLEKIVFHLQALSRSSVP